MIRKLMGLVMIGLLLVGAYVFAVTRDLPSVEKVLQDGINPTQWTQVFASDGTPIMSFGKFRHENTKLDDVSPMFLEALLATEDRRFYQHGGVDPIAVVRAIVTDLTHKKIRQGGSTLTQQLARTVFLSNERSMSRKVREAALAMQLEQKLSKQQILELYINNTYFGEGAYGIKAASEIYFGKPPSRLSVPEAALLAGLPQAPSGYSPFQNMQGARDRRNEVLENLMEVGKITSEEFERYKKAPIILNEAGRNLASSDKAPFFNHYVMEQVMHYFNLDEQSFWQSGLKVYTTLDLDAQMKAENAVVAMSRSYGRTGVNQQAALLSIDPQSGAILAYVGGKNYQRSQFDRVSQAERSPGSLFKVFTYTTAIDRGYEPTRVYLDEPVQIGDWKPENYDKSHHGYMTMAKALATSNNIVAVKVMNELGADSVAGMARQMGIKSPLQPYLGLTLGGSSVNLLEMTSAFGVLANQGVRVEPYGIDKIVDDSGHEIYQEHPVKMGVLNRTTVDTMVKMMTGVIQRGTGVGANIGRPVAGKTGTSDDYRDAWFIGFTPDVVTGVWVGNDNNTPMPGMTGGSLPAVIWRTFMKSYMAGKPIRNFDLAYSKALSDQDFVAYDIKNLSDKENNSGLAAQPGQDGEIQQDPNAPDQTPLTNPDGTSYDPNQPQTDNGNPVVEGPNNGGLDYGNGGHTPTTPESPVAPISPNPQPAPTYTPQVQPNRNGYGVIPLNQPRRQTRIDPTDSPPGNPQVIQIQPDGNRTNRSY